MQQSPHAGQPLESAGAPLLEARAAMVMLHGRGASAEDILTLADQLDQGGFTYLAPQAAGSTWWPKSFRAPLEENEPWLSSALDAVGETVGVAVSGGVPFDRVVLLGFSQGACLALEYAARNPRQYGAVVGLTGALVGPDGMPREHPGSLKGWGETPVFLGCGDPDPHIPVFRVEETEAVLTGMGASVTKRIYPGLGHTVNQDEIEFVRRMMAGVLDFSR
ncbi:MAG: dienelactone hydrolase family protein [Candidatus Dormibacteraeota bacterium]|nr:dienelactone hydrolase family protein [Candidatus Dormibacteraeota bacterium]